MTSDLYRPTHGGYPEVPWTSIPAAPNLTFRRMGFQLAAKLATQSFFSRSETP